MTRPFESNIPARRRLIDEAFAVANSSDQPRRLKKAIKRCGAVVTDIVPLAEQAISASLALNLCRAWQTDYVDEKISVLMGIRTIRQVTEIRP